MIFQHTIDAVMNGTKTQTCRKCVLCRYQVGKTYAAQPGRGKMAVCRIRVTSVEILRGKGVNWTLEGFRTWNEFDSVMVQMHGEDWLEQHFFVIGFEKVNDVAFGVKK